MKTFKEFDEHVYRHAKDVSTELPYCALALAGEAGELANIVKKRLRDHSGGIDGAARDAIVSELGDVLWYVTAAAHSIGFSLDEIATGNFVKLEERRAAKGATG